MLNNLIDGFDGRALLDFIRPNDAKFRAQREKSKKDGLQRWEAQFLYGRLKTGMKLEHPSDLGSQDFVAAIKGSSGLLYKCVWQEHAMVMQVMRMGRTRAEEKYLPNRSS